MADVNLGIGIGAEYKGRPAFNKAGKDVLGLSAGVKTLAKAYIGLAGAQKAFRFGKASVKEFVADDKAAQQLARTVTNLGMAYETTNVETLIAGLEKTFNVADDLLRPAFSKLISTTQSYTKSKDLLTVALNASAGAGVDLNTTVNDLTQAYVGNTRGLNKYKLGLTKAELAGKSFDEIQQLITKRFQGQASLAAETYSGKIDALTIAAGNAKETIGKGLVTAMQSIVGQDQGIKDATNAIDNMASSISLAIVEMGKLIGKLTDPAISALGEAKSRARTGNNSNPLFDLLYGKTSTTYDPMSQVNPGLTPAFMKLLKERQKSDALAVKRQKELAKLALASANAEKERLRLQKLKNTLEASSKVFNIDLIQNLAALQGKLTDNEILRLQTQQAILMDNADLAAKLSQQLLTAQIDAAILAGKSPFDAWTQGAILALEAMIKMREEIAKLSVPILTPSQILLNKDYIDVLKDVNDTSFADNTKEINDFLSGLSNLPINTTTSPSYQDAFARPNTANSFTNVVVSIDPTAAQYGIGVASVNNSANGNKNNYSTIQSFAGGLGL
jgi:hypothetical protein